MNVGPSLSISELANFASIAGLVISIAGLVISIWVLVNTLRLKSEFRHFYGVPRLVNKLGENALNLKKLSRKFDLSPHLIKAELSRIEANVESVQEKDRRIEAAVQKFQIAIRVYRENPADQDNFWEVHSQLLGLIEKIKNIQEDRLEER
jgi:hypothetical protein